MGIMIFLQSFNFSPSKLVNPKSHYSSSCVVSNSTLNWVQVLSQPTICNSPNRNPKRKLLLTTMTAAAGDSIATHIEQHNPSIQLQRITIQNNYSEKLVGILHETGSTEIVVLCHGFRATKDHKTIVNLAITLGKEGISTFRFDFAGNGESEGSFQYGNYHREADDLHAVIQHFSRANRVVSVIVGHSKGGDVVLLYASKYHDISTVINLSGRYNLERGIEDRLGKDYLLRVKKDGFVDVKTKTDSYRVTEESLLDRLNTNMHDACLQIHKDCRVLTVHGSADEIIPVEDAVAFSKIIPNHKLHIIDGANHGYTSHQAELAPVVLAFIKEGLQPQ